METIVDYINPNRLALPATSIVVFMVFLPFTALASPEILSFNFPDPYDSLATESLRWAGDTVVSENGISLVGDKFVPLEANYTNSYGRATYYNPLHLWDNATGRVAEFTSNFSFVMAGYTGDCYADGLTFFLTPNGTTMQKGLQEGGFGLVNKFTDIYDGSYPPFVAVEFDTYYENNVWDPGYVHVGIDVNTITSVKTAPWLWNNITFGRTVTVSVVYGSSQQILSVKMIDADNVSAFSTLEHIVDLTKYLPEWVSFGFSAATGPCSTNGEIIIQSWSFISSLEITSNKTEQLPPNTSNNTKQQPPVASPLPPPALVKEKSRYWLWIITGVGSFLLLCLVLWFLCSHHQSKRNGSNFIEYKEPIDLEFAKVTGPKSFLFREAAIATNDFSNDQLLGEGGFGKVYKGNLRELNCEVAIKKITPDSRQGIKEYATEVKTISQLRHRNLVQLVGWCHQKRELILIYEFMSNGSLDTHLFKGKSLLTWEMRYKIAQGVASALLYLHEEWEQCVIHRDIKASNIMLDSDFNAKLGDFGLARLVDHAKGSQTTILAGTLGYMAPECAYTYKVGKESDMYSFGVVILEIACGRKVTDLIDHCIRLVDWVWELYGIGKLLDAVDPKLEGDYDPRQMQCLMVVGLWCAHPNYNRRPTIREALSVMNFDALPPILPFTPPILTYVEPDIPSPYSLCDILSSKTGGGYATTGSLASSHASFAISSS